MSYLFFFSYASHDLLGNFLERFYKDLVVELISLTKHDPSRIGFRDREGIELASRWPDELAKSLAGCKAFVPILSPRHFDSKFCGKEWSCFSARLDQFARRNKGATPNLIVPISWTEPSRLSRRAFGRHEVDPALSARPRRLLSRKRTTSTYPAERTSLWGVQAFCSRTGQEAGRSDQKMDAPRRPCWSL